MSGNKYSLFLVIGLLLASCSPKIQPVDKKKPAVAEEPKAPETKAEEVKFTTGNIALLLPFRLDEISPRTASKAQIERAAMAIDFYQGFKLGLDSAAGSGLNFKLNVYDTQDNPSKMDNLLNSGKLLDNNLIVGPAFPDGLKHLKNYSVAHKIPVVSPLAASHPAEINNPFLISIVNNIDLHVQKIGNYISKNYNRDNSIVVLIDPKSGTDEIFASPLRKYFQSAKTNKFVFQEYASVYSLEPKLVKGKKYILLISSSDKKFVSETVNKLLKMQRAGLNVDLYGHPNWIKQSYAADKMQKLNTIISSSYYINYKRLPVISFVKKYRSAYNFEPTEYAFKGFDIGFYFGNLLAAHGGAYFKFLTNEKYVGLHNGFSFVYDTNLGYINTNLILLKYKDYALNPIE